MDKILQNFAAKKLEEIEKQREAVNPTRSTKPGPTNTAMNEQDIPLPTSEPANRGSARPTLDMPLPQFAQQTTTKVKRVKLKRPSVTAIEKTVTPAEKPLALIEKPVSITESVSMSKPLVPYTDGHEDSSSKKEECDTSDSIVDDLFKEFISQKMQLIEKEHKEKITKDPSEGDKKNAAPLSKSSKSTEEKKRSMKITIPNPAADVKKLDGKTAEQVKATPITSRWDSKQKKNAAAAPVTAAITVKDNPAKFVPAVSDGTNVNKTEVTDKLAEAPLVQGVKLESGSGVFEKSDSDPLKNQTVKKDKGLLKLGLKISESSVSLISSGVKIENDPKKRGLEDGELTPQTVSDSSSDSEDPDSETGSISDQDKSRKRKKKKKKSKHKSKKRKKKKRKDSESSRRRSRSRSGSRSPRISRKSRSRSRTPKRYRRSRSRSRSPMFDRKRGVWSTRTRSPIRRRRRSSSNRSRSRSKSSERPISWRDRGKEREYWDRRRRQRTRSRSRSKSPTDLRLKIDKAKLRQIAIKNAYAKIQQGGEVKGLELTAMKAGGTSVDELTDFCKRIAEKEAGMSSSDSEEAEVKGSDEEAPFIHHPFRVRDTIPNIVMNIRNAKQLPLLTATEKAQKASTLRLQFPVSSGSHHRDKESEWVPVEKTTAPATSVTSTAPKTINTVAIPATTEAQSTAPSATLAQPPPPPPPDSNPKPDSIFPQAVVNKDVNIGEMVSQRLSAMRKLNQNPNDFEARNMLQAANKEMSEWAKSKELPGQYYGSTGVRVLSQQELAGTYHAWARKDQMKTAPAVRGGIGMLLLQRMGWKQGEGLGRNKEGSTNPLLLDVKMDRRGLQAQEEAPSKVPQVKMPKDLSHKHPVSALTELCTRRKWGAPHFVVVHESGPDHKKNFLFKVTVNGVDYQPSVASANKKHARAQAATVCLQALSLLPKDSPFAL